MYIAQVVLELIVILLPGVPECGDHRYESALWPMPPHYNLQVTHGLWQLCAYTCHHSDVVRTGDPALEGLRIAESSRPAWARPRLLTALSICGHWHPQRGKE